MFSRELPDAAWHGDNLSGSFHSALLVPRSDSVRMTRGMRRGSTRHFRGSLAGSREAAAEPIPHMKHLAISLVFWVLKMGFG